MTYDYKRLCNELLSYLYQCDWPDGERFYALTERARIALVEPSPPSLKEQALQHVGLIQDNWARLGDGLEAPPSLTGQITLKQLEDIRRALEQLND